jgi:hypothetical protein
VQLCDDGLDVRQVGDDGTLLTPTALHAADGRRLWSYPSSPKATKDLGPNKSEVLNPGRVFRVNALRGVVRGPGDLGEVYMLGSVDGMSYFLTRQDGLFISMLFRPAAFAEGWDSIPTATPGMELGVLFSDPAGTRTIAREYWASGMSGMVADVPTEAKPTGGWGQILLE